MFVLSIVPVLGTWMIWLPAAAYLSLTGRWPHALALLARLFRYGQVSYHGGFVDVATSRSVPLAVDPSLWRRVRKRLVNGRNGDSVELGK